MLVEEGLAINCSPGNLVISASSKWPMAFYKNINLPLVGLCCCQTVKHAGDQPDSWGGKVTGYTWDELFNSEILLIMFASWRCALWQLWYFDCYKICCYDILDLILVSISSALKGMRIIRIWSMLKAEQIQFIFTVDFLKFHGFCRAFWPC